MKPIVSTMEVGKDIQKIKGKTDIPPFLAGAKAAAALMREARTASFIVNPSKTEMSTKKRSTQEID